MSQELADYLAARNAQSQAWVAEDPENRWASGVIEDLAFWAERGITTVEQYRFSAAVATYSDVFKSINGFRPRWKDWSGATADEVEAEIEKMVEAEERREREDREAREAAMDNTPLTHNPFAALLEK